MQRRVKLGLFSDVKYKNLTGFDEYLQSDVDKQIQGQTFLYRADYIHLFDKLITAANKRPSSGSNP
jgi:hypothetical protein